METEKEIAKRKFKMDVHFGGVVVDLVQDPLTGEVVGAKPKRPETRHELLPPPITSQTKVVCSWCGGRYTVEEMKRHYLKCFQGDVKPMRQVKKPKR